MNSNFWISNILVKQDRKFGVNSVQERYRYIINFQTINEAVLISDNAIQSTEQNRISG